MCYNIDAYLALTSKATPSRFVSFQLFSRWSFLIVLHMSFQHVEKKILEMIYVPIYNKNRFKRKDTTKGFD